MIAFTQSLTWRSLVYRCADWQRRVEESLGGDYAASPIYADGRIYFFGQDGHDDSARAGPEYKVLAVNHLDGELKASPAVAGRALFVRTRTHLYRIEEP